MGLFRKKPHVDQPLPGDIWVVADGLDGKASLVVVDEWASGGLRGVVWRRDIFPLGYGTEYLHREGDLLVRLGNAGLAMETVKEWADLAGPDWQITIPIPKPVP